MTGNYRFRPQHRLGAKSIALILGRSKRVRSGEWSLSMADNGLAIARLGLIVPKRYVPTAVGRNAIKRAIREWFRLRQQEFKGRDLLVRVLSAPRARQPQVGQLNELSSRLAR